MTEAGANTLMQERMSKPSRRKSKKRKLSLNPGLLEAMLAAPVLNDAWVAAIEAGSAAAIAVIRAAAVPGEVQDEAAPAPASGGRKKKRKKKIERVLSADAAQIPDSAE
jgi:hypothetical protein